MNYNFVLIFTIFLVALFSTPVSSESSNLKVDYYYNGQLYPGTSIPKPYLKVGEPFILGFNVTCYKECNLSVALLSSSYAYDIIEGPTSNFGDHIYQVMSANETKFFEWTIAPNDNRSGSAGSISFRYDMVDLNRGYKIAGGGPVILYAKISHLHYDGPKLTPSSDSQPIVTSSNSIPGFTILVASMTAICAVYVLRKRNE